MSRGKFDPETSLELIVSGELRASRNIKPEQRVLLEKEAAVIRSLYDSGVPLYTRARLENARKQLNQFKAGKLKNDEMKVEGLDCKTYTLLFPRVDHVNAPAKGAIRYITIQSMTVLEFMGDIAQGCKPNCVPMSPCLIMQEDDSDTHSVTEIRQLFSDHKEEWEATPQFEALKTLIASNPMLSGARKVIGFALGSLITAPLMPKVQDRTIKQYALLLSLRELIAKSSGRKVDEIACFAQDPALGPVALETLDKAGITVLDDPDAFLEVDDATVMISISPNVPVKQIITEIVRPAGIMWTSQPLEEAELCVWTDPTSTRVEAMIKNEYVDLKFPFYEPFSEAQLYVRKE